MGHRQRLLVDAKLGVYRYDQLIVLRTTQMPAVLLEAGSIINRSEELVMNSPERHSLIGAAVTDAVDGFFAIRRPRKPDRNPDPVSRPPPPNKRSLPTPQRSRRTPLKLADHANQRATISVPSLSPQTRRGSRPSSPPALIPIYRNVL